LLRCVDDGLIRCNDHIDVQAHKLSGMCCETLGPPVKVAPFDRDVSAFDIACVPQPVTECGIILNRYLASLRGNDANSGNVPLLSLGDERRNSEADSEHDREPDPPHGHLGLRWLAGV